MIKNDGVRLRKLRGILDDLKRGKTVQNRKLQTWLGEDAYQAFKDHWSNMVEFRDDLNRKPSTIQEYEQLLRTAQLMYNRAERAGSLRQPAAKGLYRQAEAAFGKALERLEEMLGQDPSLQQWLDRHCDFTAQGNLSLDPVGMPRSVTSRSLDNQSRGVSAQVASKRQCKIQSVETAIEKLIDPPTENGADELLRKLSDLAARKAL